MNERPIYRKIAFDLCIQTQARSHVMVVEIYWISGSP